jgi:hypothetical protein
MFELSIRTCSVENKYRIYLYHSCDNKSHTICAIECNIVDLENTMKKIIKKTGGLKYFKTYKSRFYVLRKRVYDSNGKVAVILYENLTIESNIEAVTRIPKDHFWYTKLDRINQIEDVEHRMSLIAHRDFRSGRQSEFINVLSATATWQSWLPYPTVRSIV